MAPRIFIFSIVLGTKYLSYVKSIETHARSFLTLNILSIGTVSLNKKLTALGRKKITGGQSQQRRQLFGHNSWFWFKVHHRTTWFYHKIMFKFVLLATASQKTTSEHNSWFWLNVHHCTALPQNSIHIQTFIKLACGTWILVYIKPKLYIPSSINIWKKVLTKAIWADKKWTGFCQISLYIK